MKHRHRLWPFLLLIAATVCLLCLCSSYTGNRQFRAQGQEDGYRAGYEHGQRDSASKLPFVVPALNENLFPSHAPTPNQTGYNLYRSCFFDSYGGGYSDGYEEKASRYP